MQFPSHQLLAWLWYLNRSMLRTLPRNFYVCINLADHIRGWRGFKPSIYRMHSALDIARVARYKLENINPYDRHWWLHHQHNECILLNSYPSQLTHLSMPYVFTHILVKSSINLYRCLHQESADPPRSVSVNISDAGPCAFKNRTSITPILLP